MQSSPQTVQAVSCPSTWEDLTSGRNQFAKKPVMLQFLLGWEDVYVAKATQVFENAVVFAMDMVLHG